MENVQIGNWLITNDGIEWTGKPFGGYFINKETLLKDSGEKPGAYDWLLHMAHKRWLKEPDVHAFNTAFMAALFLFVPKHQKGKLSLAKTLEEQKRILGYKPINVRTISL